MASVLNSEFNYRTQVVGETVWEKIKTLKGFLEGRKSAAALEKVAVLRYEAKLEKLKWMRTQAGALPHEIMELEAEIMEHEAMHTTMYEAYELNKGEIATLERLLAEAYAIAEPTRIPGYTDHQMFEANAANEFTIWVAKELQAEIIATGHPSPAKLRNAMSNPETWAVLKQVGIVPKDAYILVGNVDPLKIGINVAADVDCLPPPTEKIQLTHKKL